MKITVYAHDADEVVKKLERIGKKAAKYGVPFSFERGEEHPQRVNVYRYDEANHCEYLDEKSFYNVAAVDFEVNCEAFIKANGWRVCAKVEHGDKGNIVTGFGDSEIDPAWYDAPARCDHCNTNRKRAVTFMVKREDGTVRQVGRSCLLEYTGIDPATALLWASVRDIYPQDFNIRESEFNEMRSALVYDVELVLAHAVDAVKAKGYRKAGDRDSTRDQVAKLLREDAIPSAEGKAKAKQIVEWLIESGTESRAIEARRDELYEKAGYGDDGLPEDEEAAKEFHRFCQTTKLMLGVERDCFALAQSGWAKTRHIGRLAYMPIAYDKAMERKSREEARVAGKAAEAERSEYVSEVGKRIEIDVASAKIITSWETDYGRTFLYKFVDADGNVFIWRASGMMYDSKADRVIPEETIKRIKGTVKEHSEYDGVKQTVLTRCKAI